MQDHPGFRESRSDGLDDIAPKPEKSEKRRNEKEEL